MTRWICPDCGGGFPHAIMYGPNDTHACPWCAYTITEGAAKAIVEAKGVIDD